MWNKNRISCCCWNTATDEDLSCIFIVDMTFNNCNFKIAGENCLLGKCVWIEQFVDHQHYNMPMRRQKRWPIESHKFSAKWYFPTTIYCRRLALAIQYSEVSGQLTDWLSVGRRQRSIRITTNRYNIASKTKLGAMRNHVEQGCGFLHRMLETNLMHVMCIHENDSCVPNLHYATAIIVFIFATRLFDL